MAVKITWSSLLAQGSTCQACKGLGRKAIAGIKGKYEVCTDCKGYGYVPKIMDITYVKGDAASIGEQSSQGIIVHMCNDCGRWAKGFALKLSRRWGLPEDLYKKDARQGALFLGQTRMMRVTPTLCVFNMVVFHGLRTIRFEALNKCLAALAISANATAATVHIPMIDGWGDIEAAIRQTLTNTPVVVYDDSEQEHV